jgi:hypothetical protein
MILYSQWLSLPITTRHLIAEKFGILKKSPTHVVDNKIQSDGFLVQDVESALSVEALQKFLNVKCDNHIKLWNELVYRMEHPEEVIIPVEVYKALKTMPILKDEKKKQIKRGTNKGAKK